MTLLSRAVHGGNVHRLASRLGVPASEILDFSASINPLGIPPEVDAAIRAAIPEQVHYPEPYAASLVDAIADHHGCDPARVVVGPGSTDLIYRVVEGVAPDRGIIFAPAFGEYRQALARFRVPLRWIPCPISGNGVVVPDSVPAAICGDRNLIFLANPGNPHGQTVSEEVVVALLSQMEGRGFLLLDEAFIDYAPERSLVHLLDQHPNLIILRSLTKFYAIPGIRVGYLLTSPEIAGTIAALQPPWQLSGLAMAAAKASFQAGEYAIQSRELNNRLRDELAKGLKGCGLPVLPGEANYLLVQGKRSFRAGADFLEVEGILVRLCGDFWPLDDSWMRLAVNGTEANGRLLTALRQLKEASLF